MVDQDPVARLCQEAWNEGQLETVDEVVAANAVLHAGAETMHGAAALRLAVETWRAAFPDIHHTIDDRFAALDRVATRWHGEGTQRGEFAGIPPTGKRVSYWGITIWRIADGVIQEALVGAAVPQLIASLRESA